MAGGSLPGAPQGLGAVADHGGGGAVHGAGLRGAGRSGRQVLRGRRGGRRAVSRRAVGGLGVQAVKAVAKVGHEAGSQGDVHSWSGGEAAGDLSGGMGEASPEAVSPAKAAEVANCQFQYIGFLQLGDVLALGLKGGDHQLLELVEAPVDAGSALPLQHGLHHLPVLVGAGHGANSLRPEGGVVFVSDFVRHRKANSVKVSD